MKNLSDFLLRYKGRLVRYWIYKTPGVEYPSDLGWGSYEMEQCEIETLREMYELPNGDVLVEFESTLSDKKKYSAFYPLSRIHIDVSDSDLEEK